MKRVFLLAAMAILSACKTQKPMENPDPWRKIKIDFKNIDAEGMVGQGKGKVALNYEFCVPREEKNWKQVCKIDPTAQRSESRGRVGCKEDQWLIIGTTNQKNYQRVLYELASLDFVARIDQVFWE